MAGFLGTPLSPELASGTGELFLDVGAESSSDRSVGVDVLGGGVRLRLPSGLEAHGGTDGSGGGTLETGASAERRNRLSHTQNKIHNQVYPS